MHISFRRKPCILSHLLKEILHGILRFLCSVGVLGKTLIQIKNLMLDWVVNTHLHPSIMYLTHLKQFGDDNAQYLNVFTIRQAKVLDLLWIVCNQKIVKGKGKGLVGHDMKVNILYMFSLRTVSRHLFKTCYFIKCSLKWDSHLSRKIFYICFNDRPSKMIKNAFYSIAI